MKETAQTKLDWVKARIAEGRTVYFSTPMRKIKITTSAHVAMIEARNNGLFVRSGKSAVCVDYCKLSAV